MFKDPNTGEESHLKDRIWSTIGDLESRGYARVSAHVRVSDDTVVSLTPEGHEQAKVVLAEVVDACLLQRIPPRRCQRTKLAEPLSPATMEHQARGFTLSLRRSTQREGIHQGRCQSRCDRRG
jgi:hypothetical protein